MMVSRLSVGARLIAVFVLAVLALIWTGRPVGAVEPDPLMRAMTHPYTYDAPTYGSPGAEGTSAADRALAQLPKAARESPKAPGFNPETGQWREGSRANVPRSWWDPAGGEWRFHPEDNWHDPHWDYNPWEQWNNPWQHLYPGD